MYNRTNHIEKLAGKYQEVRYAEDEQMVKNIARCEERDREIKAYQESWAMTRLTIDFKQWLRMAWWEFKFRFGY